MKRQQSLAVEKNVEDLLAKICRDAPTLLNYIPSYKEKLKRREKEKEPSTKVGGKMKATDQQAGKGGQPNPCKKTK
ncbi:hypothetical protein RHMOL_Rhmol09G0103400 [Rhododendron molle]|uniref:Uncharacterized protein n=1 Tax=Rhododendron molle TaxID=49168 RepID=A0ACC0MD61_RHOML|nr:hypothetical protein RHMOL_Rhmol09G0103400 [Rhododendron molle]